MAHTFVGCSSPNASVPAAAAAPEGGAVEGAQDATAEPTLDHFTPDSPLPDAGPLPALLVGTQVVQGVPAALSCIAVALLYPDGHIAPVPAGDTLSARVTDSATAVAAAPDDCDSEPGAPPFSRQMGVVGLVQGSTAASVHVLHNGADISVAIQIHVNDHAIEIGPTDSPIILQVGSFLDSPYPPLVLLTRTAAGDLIYDPVRPVPKWLTTQVDDPTIGTETRIASGWRTRGLKNGQTTVHFSYNPIAVGHPSAAAAVIKVASGVWQGDARVRLDPEDGGDGVFIEPEGCVKVSLMGTYFDAGIGASYSSVLPSVTWTPLDPSWTKDPAASDRFCIHGTGSTAIKGCSAGTCAQAGVIALTLANRPTSLTVTPSGTVHAMRTVAGGATAFCPALHLAVTPKSGPSIDVTANPSATVSASTGTPPPFFLAQYFDAQGGAVLDQGSRCLQLSGGGLAPGSSAPVALNFSAGAVPGPTLQMLADF